MVGLLAARQTSLDLGGDSGAFLEIIGPDRAAQPKVGVIRARERVVNVCITPCMTEIYLHF